MNNNQPPLAIIGGSGLDVFDGLENPIEKPPINTPFGQPSAGLVYGKLSGSDVVFLARHGKDHQYAPHRVNYRANIHALASLGVRKVIAVAAVGGITEVMENRVLVVPDQLIDYTSGRLSSFSDRPDTVVQHVDFSYPFTRELSQRILDAASRQNIVVQDGGIYGVTEGPRLETAAEISRMEKDGCDLVGMTLMPEAVLAREAGLDYAALALVVNRAAGKSQELITMDMIKSNLQEGMSQVRSILCGVMAMSVRVCD